MKAVNLIPADKRKELVEKNIIANAIAIPSNAYLKYLFVIWYNYVEPGKQGDIDCAYCRQNILNNFRSMQNDLIALYREDQLLESI